MIVTCSVPHSASPVVVPPAGCLLFDPPHGDVHVTVGIVTVAPRVLKKASAFHDNPERDLPDVQGASMPAVSGSKHAETLSLGTTHAIKKQAILQPERTAFQ